MAADAWSIFAKTLTQEMAKTDTSSRDLQRRLREGYPTLTEETVANWRRGRSRPSLEMLGPIVDAVNFERRTPAGEEPFSLLVLLEKMKVIPSDPAADAEVFDRAYRLLKLQLKQQDAEDAFSELGRKASAARIVQATVASSKWAVAVWPAFEGPSPAYSLHIADRIDIRRIDPEAGDVDDAVWADPAMKAALRGTNAMPSTQSRRWSELPNAGNIGESVVDDVSRWAISHVTSPREPVVTSHWNNIRAVALVATTRKSLVNEVASLVAVGLGYGVIATPQLAIAASGRRPTNTRVVEQYNAHQHLLSHPPHRRVWSHWGMPPGLGDQPFGVYSNVEHSTPRFILLDESNEMLSESVDGRLGSKELTNARDTLRAAARGFPREHLLELKTESLLDRHERWGQVFTQAAEILTWLSGPGMGVFPARLLRETHMHAARRDPDVAAPFLDWLKSEGGWPRRDEAD